MSYLVDEQMLAAEAEVLGARHEGDAGTLYRHLNSRDACALCLSGGGIRSASFALGLVQALASLSRTTCKAPSANAEESLLADMTYLSTVSGGGYIGSWLAAWRSREDFPTVWSKLTAQANGSKGEAPQLQWLRQNSNFLTPKLGLTSADAWTAVAMMLRNLILNWIVVLPVICAILLVLKLYLASVAWLADGSAEGTWFLWFGLASLFLLSFALRFTTRNRPSLVTENQRTPVFWGLCLLPSLLSAALLSASVSSAAVTSRLSDFHLWELLLACGCIGLILYAASWIAAWPHRRHLHDLLIWAVAGIVFGMTIGLGLRALSYVEALDWLVDAKLRSPALLILMVFGVPWILVSQMIAEMVFVGLTSYQDNSDADREWFARSAGWHCAAALSWALVMGLTFLGPFLVTSVVAVKSSGWLSTGLAALGGVSGVATALLGMSSRTQASAAAKAPSKLNLNVILAIAAPIFAAMLVLALAWALDQLLLGHPLHKSGLLREPDGADDSGEGDLVMLLAGLVGVLILGRIASRSVNINRFSLHALYRNRLVRAFLGASNPTRRKPPRNEPGPYNWFTGFDEADNVRMHQLWVRDPAGRTGGWRPFHVINAALNVVASSNLAWQERKAEPFTFTPLHSGSSLKGYRDSRTYGDRQGVSLGTAMAISGAAASPNMGYHSSPPLMLLMSLCNVRLGWWLGNPGKEGERTYQHDGPHTAVRPLLQEAFGLTTDDKDYVYLSDGGHFENLGLYEMVRRRCRYIVVSDAGCDPDHAFEDLSNAVRKIGIDLGVGIRFAGLDQLKPRNAVATAGKVIPSHAIGTIDYAEADGDGKEGYILYIKASYHGSENAGVRGYAAANPAFPHEPTADQWFSESQFESYRALGYEIMSGIYRSACEGMQPTGGPPRLATIIEALRARGD